jgi:hypothetical protein
MHNINFCLRLRLKAACPGNLGRLLCPLALRAYEAISLFQSLGITPLCREVPMAQVHGRYLHSLSARCQ